MIEKLLESARKFARAFIPEKKRADFEIRISRTGWNHDPYVVMGLHFFLLVSLMIIIYFWSVVPRIQGEFINQPDVNFVLLFVFFTFVYVLIFLLLTLIVSWYIFQYVISSWTYKRTKAVESVLEDYLRYVAENLRGGMAFQQALWNSIKPEFGVLAEEIEIVTKKVVTGTELEVALEEFTEKYDSPMLKRTFSIISESLQGGGNASDTLDDIIENLSSLKQLKAELISTNTNYSIFINAIVLFITPLLFALSTQFIFVLDQIGDTVGDSLNSAGNLGGFGALTFSGAALSIDEFRAFAIWILVINSIGASVLTTIINKGDIRQLSLVNLAVYPAVSAFLYIVLTRIATNLFSGILV